MEPEKVGDILMRWLGTSGVGRTECVQVGLMLAFNWPEWARALMEAGGNTEDAEVVVNRLQAFIDAHPIEQHPEAVGPEER